MPRIRTFARFALFMYSKERHRMPHIHVEAPEARASLALDTGEVLAGNAPADMLREARKFIAANRDGLLARWKELNG